jgi:ectoine hydroxylase-related dioxygenase (phytanoyl-CoA dioxygenase family)
MTNQLAMTLTASGKTISTDPEHFGELQSSLDIVDDGAALRERMDAEGYLFLPGYLGREPVLEARREVARRIEAAGLLAPGTPAEELVAHPDADVAFMPELAADNAPVYRLLYEGPMIALYERLLGGEVRHFDFTWMRAVAPGRGTPPHMDIVFMGRGTTRLFTSWTPLGDIPIEMGGLMILERSHKHDRINNHYGRKDVDQYCLNHAGDEEPVMGRGGNIGRGGALSNHPAKLRDRLGGRWLTTNFHMGDVLLFSMFTIHTSLDNHSDRIRISSDTRYQLASEPIDERWIGEHPIAHGPEAKQGIIC